MLLTTRVLRSDGFCALALAPDETSNIRGEKLAVKVVSCFGKFDGRFRGLPVNNYVRNDYHCAVELLKPAEVAVLLSVSRTWLYDAAKAGRIPAIRIGGPEGPLRFVPEDVQRWIDDARTAWFPGGPAPPTRSL